MNPSLIPFVLMPVLLLGGGITLIIMANTGDGPYDIFVVLGIILTAMGVILPLLFGLVTRPRKKR